jgi:hypothetical protein
LLHSSTFQLIWTKILYVFDHQVIVFTFASKTIPANNRPGCHWRNAAPDNPTVFLYWTNVI